MRAVLEGVAYSLEDTFALFRELGIPVTGIRLGGGGARGALWRKIQAGIYGHAVEVLAAEEGGAFGCALMAGVGAGHWKNLDEACGQAIEVAQRIEPDARRCGGVQGRVCAVEEAVSGAARTKKLGFRVRGQGSENAAYAPATTKSAKVKPSRVTISPVVSGSGAENIGPA